MGPRWSTHICTLLRLTYNWPQQYCPALLSRSVISSSNILPKLLPLQQGSEGEILHRQTCRKLAIVSWLSLPGSYKQTLPTMPLCVEAIFGSSVAHLARTHAACRWEELIPRPPNSPSAWSQTNLPASQPKSAHQHLRQCLYHASKRCNRMVVRSSEVEERVGFGGCTCVNCMYILYGIRFSTVKTLVYTVLLYITLVSIIESLSRLLRHYIPRNFEL